MSTEKCGMCGVWWPAWEMEKLEVRGETWLVCSTCYHENVACLQLQREALQRDNAALHLELAKMQAQSEASDP